MYARAFVSEIVSDWIEIHNSGITDLINELSMTPGSNITSGMLWKAQRVPPLLLWAIWSLYTRNEYSLHSWDQVKFWVRAGFQKAICNIWRVHFSMTLRCFFFVSLQMVMMFPSWPDLTTTLMVLQSVTKMVAVCIIPWYLECSCYTRHLNCYVK